MPSFQELQLRERFQASILGAAIADALAFPFEGVTPEVMRGVAYDPAAKFYQRRGCNAGDYSDDTQQMIAVAGALIEKGDAEGNSVAMSLSRLWTEGQLRYTDNTCTDAMRRYLTGIGWAHCGAPAGHASDMAAVRAAPVGLFFNECPQVIAEKARIQAQCTHRDARAQAGAVAMAYAAGLCVNQKRDVAVDGAAFCLELSSVVRPVSEEMSARLAELPRYLDFPPLSAALVFSHYGVRREDWRGFSGMGNFVCGSVCFALYCFLKAGTNFRRCVEMAVRAGGNSPSIACMAGALFGARYGLACIPLNLQKGVAYGKDLMAIGASLFRARPTNSHSEPTVACSIVGATRFRK